MVFFLFKIKLQHKQLNNQPELKPETSQSFCISYEDNFRSVSGFYYCWLLCNCRLYASWICCCSIFQFYQTHLVFDEIEWNLRNVERLYWKRSRTSFRFWMSIAEEKLVLYYSIFLIFSRFYSISNNSTMNKNRTMKLCEYILCMTKTNIAKWNVSILVGCWEIVDCLICWWYFLDIFKKFKLILYWMDYLETCAMVNAHYEENYA